jgi:putative ABC transport system ATP-binding protein
MEIAASIKGASKEYKTGDTVITALQPTTFDFMKNELTLIIGPSGSGKTTLLSLLGCVIFETSGELYIDNALLWTYRISSLSSMKNEPSLYLKRLS